ncbi:MAG: outer membrane protein transport protein, partial [Polyangiales bacterium]
IEKFGFTLNFSALLVDQWAPVQGPNTRLNSGLGLGPLPAAFVAGRIAPRVVFSAGIYIETGYGSDFSDVTCLDGDVVGPGPDYEPATLDSNPQCSNPQPEDLNVSFFVGEFSAGTSIRVTDNFWIGVALRLPFSKQVADLYQNVGAAIGFVNYDRVKNDLGGVGFPSPRFGFTWKPHEKISIGAMYRMYSKIKLSGTTESSLITGITGEDSLNARADWFVPHAIQAGIAFFPNERVVLAIEGRAQFHGASKTGNKTQTVVVDTPADSPIEIAPIIVPFGWKNAWSVKVGAEYRFPIDMLLIRGGANFAQSATSGEFAQYFTPPPGYSGFLSTGLGFYFDGRGGEKKDMYLLDLAGAFAFSVGKIGNEFIGQTATIPGTDQETVLCSDQQVVRTGCPGDLGVYTYFLTLGFTVQY